MSDLLTCRDLTKNLGDRLLFKGVNFVVREREKIALIGPNGVGKSTFLKTLAGIVEYDSGELIQQKNLRMAYIPQMEEFDPEQTILQAGLEALKNDVGDEFEKETAISIALGRIGFEDIQQKVGSLSGGWLKRLSIARQVAREPDLLLLDEPTNHLDVEGIEWLESYLSSANFAYVVISHDRQFLQKCTHRTLEINHRYKETFWSYDAPYETFIQKKEDHFAVEKQRASNLANKARTEDHWLKQGVRARGTKQEARKKEAYELFNEVADLKHRTKEEKKISLEFESTEKKTKRLLTLHNIHKSLGGKKLIEGLDLTLTPGTRVGLLGNNGVGKSTLMNIIEGSLNPDQGKVVPVVGCQIVKFDQNRALLDKELTLREALTPAGSDMVDYRGERIHIASWAGKLKFRSDQLESGVKSLSGGEQARVLLGQLMLQKADILLLDEPTNDLDIPSIELLEESLKTFPGAVVLITHDREMLSRVATVLLGFEGDGQITTYSDYNQWKKRTEKNTKKEQKVDVDSQNQSRNSVNKPVKKVTKLSYKEQREWDGMEENILQHEMRLEHLQANPVDSTNTESFTKYCEEMASLQSEIEYLYQRWSELESKISELK